MWLKVRILPHLQTIRQRNQTQSRALKFDANRQVQGLAKYGDLREEEKDDASLSTGTCSALRLLTIDRAVDEEVYGSG